MSAHTQSDFRLLIVEDDDAIRELYSLKLQQQNFTVATAVNGLEGLKLAEKQLPDLILLDLRMPVMDGEHMLAKLRSTDWGSTIRVIVLTNISKSEAPHSLRFLSVDRYAVKVHHTPTQIVEMVREVLGVS